MKKRWSDYLWVAELLYLALGLCNILFAWLGMLFFAIPLLVAVIGGNKAYCNRFCGRGQLLGLLGGRLKLSRNVPPPRFFAQPLVPVRLSGVFYDHVCADGVQHLSGVYRRAAAADRHSSVGVQAAVAVGAGGFGGALGRAVRLRLFRRDADVHRAGAYHDGAVPAPVVVRVLPHGDDDPGNLSTETGKGMCRLWKNRRRKLRSF